MSAPIIPTATTLVKEAIWAFLNTHWCPVKATFRLGSPPKLVSCTSDGVWLEPYLDEIVRDLPSKSLRGCLKSKGYGKSIGKFFSEGAYRDGIPERLAG